MNQTGKDILINKAELEIIGNMYRQKRYDACLKAVKSKLKKTPNSLHLLNYQAMAYSALKRDKEALLSYQKIIKRDPTLAGPYYNMGIILKRNGRIEEAIDSYKKALSLKPDYVQVYNNLGVLYKDNEKYEDAIKMFTKAKELQPDHQNSYYNLALIKKEQGQSEEAIELLLKVLDLNPEHGEAKYDIAMIKKDKGLLEEAKNYLQDILNSDRKNQEAVVSLAKVYSEVGNFDCAISSLRKAINANPKNRILYHNLGLCLVTIGELKEGWKSIESIWEEEDKKSSIWFKRQKKIWTGDKTSKSLLLWRRGQGIGEDIIFLSLVSEVKEMCSSLSVYIDPRLQALCERAMPEINFVKDIEELQNVDCDYHLPLGSVPGLIRNDISDFDRTVKGYFKADPERVEAIRNELGLDGKKVIGISWKSLQTKYKKKSVQLRDMERLFSGLDVVLVNLQYGDVEDEIREFKDATGIEVVQCASVDNREDLDGLAALIEVCDLVVSTSNVTVHMAGALAKDTWVLLHYVSIYFWLVERTDSIWYPSLTLYRQPTLDDWDSVYASIRKDLQKRLAIT